MKFKTIILILAALSFQVAHADEAPVSASAGLDQLSKPMNELPAGVSAEKMYSVQNRYSDLSKRFEVSIGGAHNFTGSSFVNSNQVDLSALYHINNRWHVTAYGSYAFNSFTDSTRGLIQDQHRIPDAAYVKTRMGALVGYHTLYGKFRLGMDKAFYFDQYVAVGPSMISSQYQTAMAGTADIGFALWFDKDKSVRFGVKNDFYTEKRLLDSGFRHDVLAHIGVGYIFGESKGEL